MEALVFLHELVNSIFFSKLDREVNEGLLLLDELLVLDSVVARVNLAYQVEPRLLLLGSNGAISDLVIEHGKLVLVSLVLRLALILIRIERVGLALFANCLILLWDFDADFGLFSNWACI